MDRRLLVGLAFALVFGLLSLGVTGMAAAQDEDALRDALEEEDAPTEISDQLGDLVVHSYEYDSETETMTIEATWLGDRPTTVTLTEMIELDSGGSTEISFQEQRLTPDETVSIEMGAAQRSGGTAAVLVSTPQSIDEGNALVLQAGDAGGGAPIPFQSAVLIVGLACAGTGGGSFLVVRHFASQETETKERLA